MLHLHQKHHEDKENKAVAARQLADRKAKDAMIRASELQQLERLLSATVASSGLKQLDLRQLNVSLSQSAAVSYSAYFAGIFAALDAIFTVDAHSALSM